MGEECIHGFADGLCATCNPKPVSETVAVARPVARRRVTAAPRTTVRSLRASARIPVGTAPVGNLVEQRIYHVTHIGNLAGIIGQGAITAGARPVVDISSAPLRDARREISIPGDPGAALADFVPFLLSPEAGLWRSLRAGLGHPRLSPDRGVADPLEFVFLVSTVRAVIASARTFVVADGDAEGASTRFATGREDAERMLHRLRAGGPDVLVDAEFLVAGALPLESVPLIGVANERVRQSVRDLLADSGFAPKISVYPPWFQQQE